MTTDDALAEDHNRRLNEEFYSTHASHYFRHRLAFLALQAGKPQAVEDLLAEEFAWGSVKFSSPKNDQDGLEARTSKFVITESQVLLHHASEALFRLFIAHAGAPACPWLEIASLTSFKTFHKYLDAFRADPWRADLTNDAAHVFLGGRPTNADEQWNEALQSSVRLIRLLANRFHADRNMYNATKHGMAVTAGEGSIGIFTEDGRPVINTDGTQVTFLEHETTSDHKNWYRKAQWFNAPQAAWLTELALNQIDLLWDVAKHRYLGAPLDGLNVVTPEAIDAALNNFPATGSVRSYRTLIATEPL